MFSNTASSAISASTPSTSWRSSAAKSLHNSERLIRHLAPLAVAAGFGEPDSSPRTWPHHTPLMLVPVGLMALVGIPAAVMVAAQTTLIQTGVADPHRGRLFGSFLRHDGPEQPDGPSFAGALGDVVGMVPLLTIDSLGYMCGGVFVLS